MDQPRNAPASVPRTAPWTSRLDDEFGQRAIYRLFAVGLDLHLVLGLTEHPQATERLCRAISELDMLIKEIQIAALAALTAEPAGIAAHTPISRPAASRSPRDGPTTSAIADLSVRLDAQDHADFAIAASWG